jgi:hypothetical protein
MLILAIATEAFRNGMVEYDDSIVPFLQALATQNESGLMESERAKTALERRGLEDALVSARIIVRQAAEYARARRGTTLTVEDVQRAYRAQFCRVWPFCR